MAHSDEDALLGPLAQALGDAGLRVRLRAAGKEDVQRSGSSWARRLGIPDRRPAWLLIGRRA